MGYRFGPDFQCGRRTESPVLPARVMRVMRTAQMFLYAMVLHI